jgi:hypothetical protein
MKPVEKNFLRMQLPSRFNRLPELGLPAEDLREMQDMLAHIASIGLGDWSVLEDVLGGPENLAKLDRFLHGTNPAANPN